MTPLISVIVPTVTGREDLLRRCVDAYRERSAYPVQIATYLDRQTCGIVWQEGGDEAKGDYLHFTADDLEPHEGWDVAALATVADGFLPAPRVVGPDGAPQYLPGWGAEHEDGIEVSMSVIPFLSREMWEKAAPLFTGHYFTDNWISARCAAAGWPPRLALGYSFSHHWGQPGRGAGMPASQRMEVDRIDYETATAMAAAGKWDAPWPNKP